MSAAAQSDAISKSAAKKKKKNNKKANGKSGTAPKQNEANDTTPIEQEDAADDDDNNDQEGSTPMEGSRKGSVVTEPVSDGKEDIKTAGPDEASELERTAASTQVTDDTSAQNGTTEAVTEPLDSLASVGASIAADASERLEALQQERDGLRAEVTQLRLSLESLQKSGPRRAENGEEGVDGDDDDDDEGEVARLKEELEQSQSEKEHAETQYRNLLGKVNTIRSQLGERLKADAAELEQARARIEDLETTESAQTEENERLQRSITDLNSQLEEQRTEVSALRNRTNLSTSNWTKERDDLVQREAIVREEYEVAKQAMQDWEILATEERSRREALEEKVQELEDQLASQSEAYERIKDEATTQSSTVDGLQRAFREMQEERKRELRDIVEKTESQLKELREQAATAEKTAADLQIQLTTTESELARAIPFEKEVKEKNLLIGKLRHEAVILNDHLTKALRFLKRGKPEDNVDRMLVTNHFLHFLALDRSDPKKFQVLQLIAALLGWTDEQKEQAGLQRGGGIGSALNSPASTGSLRLPLSPFRRTSSIAGLAADNPFSPTSMDSPGTGKETLAELWSEFLEREALTGGSVDGSRPGTRRQSSATNTGVMSPGVMSPGPVPRVKEEDP